MANLYKVEAIVKKVLTKHPEARDDDFLLVFRAYKKMNPSIKGMYFWHVMRNHKELGLPSFESITRARRKLQSNFPELKSSSKAAEIRAEEYMEYIDYSTK